MSSLPKQKELIEEEDWDCLIILDACRYDCFRENYEDYLSGTLQKVRSLGSWTPEWLKKTFEKYYQNTVYVSANPYVNSSGRKIEGFDGTKHFAKVVDVWKSSWDSSLKTVPPEPVGKITRITRAKYPDKRLISHFVQPHASYLTIGPVKWGGFSGAYSRAKREGERNKSSDKDMMSSLKGKIRNLAKRSSIILLGERRASKFARITGLRKLNPVELVAEKYDNGTLREAYKENLRVALSEVAKTVDRLPGKVVITSDHGNLLGEDGIYEHPHWYNGPILRAVPWLRVKRSN